MVKLVCRVGHEGLVLQEMFQEESHRTIEVFLRELLSETLFEVLALLQEIWILQDLHHDTLVD